MDALQTLIQGSYADSDGDGKKSDGDTYGFVVTNPNETLCNMNAFNLKGVTLVDGYPELTYGY